MFARLIFTALLSAPSAIAAVAPFQYGDFDLVARADGDKCLIQLANPPPPSTTICGLKGKISNPALLRTINRVASVESCVASCQSSTVPKCQSFSYDQTTKVCSLYSKRIVDQGWRRLPGSTSTLRFWSINCWACTCSEGLTNCGGTCTDLSSNANNCNSCGNACGGDGSSATTCCSGQCVDLQTDEENCGTCGNQIFIRPPLVPQPSCCNGQAENRSSNNNCGGDCNRCEEEFDCCNGSCIDYSSDLGNCGSCGHQCPANAMCNSGTCQCPPDMPNLCSGVCINTFGGNCPRNPSDPSDPTNPNNPTNPTDPRDPTDPGNGGGR